jgi:hypothetical protein
MKTNPLPEYSQKSDDEIMRLMLDSQSLTEEPVLF